MRIARNVILGIFAILFCGFAYLYFRQPATAPAINIVVSRTPERIERGRYIFEHVADCDGCHSERDYARLYAPTVETGRGRGNELPIAGLPGRVVAPNITPDRETGIGTWTDGEKMRAIREGVDKDGHALFPLMPYAGYRNMSDDDVQALVAYLDTLPPIRNALPKTQIDFFVGLMIKGAPQPVRTAVHAPDPNNPVAWGEYMVSIAGCSDCHTPQVHGQPDMGRQYAGGFTFTMPPGTVTSANITPDKDTGIGGWDYPRFRDRMRISLTYGSVADLPKVGPDRFTLMPYLDYAGMTDQDIAAIFAYLQTRTPISQKVEAHGAANTDK